VPVKPGQRIGKGERIATVHARTEDGAAVASAAVREAITIGEGDAACLPLIGWRVTASGKTPYGVTP
jgi:thymidine phosphorylase